MTTILLAVAVGITYYIGYLRARSLPVLALVEAARIVLGRTVAKCKHDPRKALKSKIDSAVLGPRGAQTSIKVEQLRLIL